MRARSLTLLVTLSVASLVEATSAFATTTVIPDSALVPSTTYYTNNLGTNIVTTGGGNGANVGDPSGRNDDGYMVLSLGFNVTFFGTTYNTLYINNNGNVSFGNGISAYIPSGPTGASQPVISPYFGDVDTRNLASGVVYYQTNTANQLVVTWDQVGYFGQHADKLNSFQLVLRGDDYVVPDGEGKIGFFWTTMDWEVTDTSVVAAVGFGDGSGNGEVLESSLASGLNDILENHELWFDANLVPVDQGGQTPLPAALPLFASGVGGLGFLGWRRKRKNAALAKA